MSLLPAGPVAVSGTVFVLGAVGFAGALMLPNRIALVVMAAGYAVAVPLYYVLRPTALIGGDSPFVVFVLIDAIPTAVGFAVGCAVARRRRLASG